MSDKTNINPESNWPKNHGMTVPEGFFADFERSMMERIDREQASAPKVVEMPRKTLWQTVRPYVYMAAMFAGIWLMMNMFTLFTPKSMNQPLLLADVMNSGTEGYVEDYMGGMSDYDLYDDLYDSGFQIPDRI